MTPVWVGGLLALLAVTQGALALRHNARSRLRTLGPAVAGAVVGVLLLALITLPTRSPWSPGQTLWLGIVLGGMAVGGGALLAPKADGDAREEALASALQAGCVSLGVLILVFIFRGRVLDSLAGFAVGALASGMLLVSGALGDGDERHSIRGAVSGAETTTLTAVALAVTTYLAAFHRSPLGAREWLPLPALLLATFATACAVRAVVGRPDDRGLLMSVAAIGVPLAVTLGLLAGPLHGSIGLVVAYLAGLLIFLGVAELAHWETEGDTAFGVDLRLLGALALLGGAIVAFRSLHGYGLGLAALGAITGFGLESIGRGGARMRDLGLPWAVVLLLTLVLYRAYTERTGYSRGFTPDFFYYYVALVVGALLPGVFGSVASFRGPRGGVESGAGWSSVLRSGAVALVAAATPLAAWVLIGPRPQAALLVGLTVAAAVTFRGVGGAAAVAQGRPEPLRRLGVVLVAVAAWQFTPLLEPLAMLTRLQRVGVLAAIGVVVLGVMALGAWLGQRDHRRPGSTAPE